MTAHRLEVWGDPISHSLSPALHAAAYAVLGLDWSYGRRQVAAADFADALASLDDNWRGLSLTMPLKEEAFRAAASRDSHAELTGAVNTLLLGDEPVGFNTDVGGIVDALTERGIHAVEHVRIVGAGATAASALVAASVLGAARAEVRARRPERAAPLAALGERLGIHMTVTGLDGESSTDAREGLLAADVTFATLPGGTVLPPAQTASLVNGAGALFEAAYAPWPSALAAQWRSGPVVSGLGMLLHQAIRQVRVFLHGDPAAPLDEEAAVLAAMRGALPGNVGD